MDSSTTAGRGGGGVPFLRLDLDPATVSALQDVFTCAIGVCLLIGIVVLIALVIKHFRGPKRGLEEPAGCFPGGDDDGDRAPQPQQPAAEAMAIEVVREDDAVPVVIIFRANDNDVDGRWEPTCAVCQAELAGGGSCTALSPCRHCFHSTCAREWVGVHATCPLCQAPVAAAGATV